MSIRKTPTGKFAVRWREGSRHRSRSFDRLKDARAFEAAQRRDAQLGAFATSEPAATLLSEWLKEWFRTSSWARSTRIDRGAVVDRWIAPYVGHIPLRDLGRARIVEYRAEMIGQGASTYVANKAIVTLSAALGAAVERDLIPSNPCHGIKRLRHQVAPVKALSVDAIEAIRAQAENTRDAALVSLMAYGGLRPEEALGLKWEDIEGRSMIIRRVFTAGEVREQTKTARWRSVPIPEPLAADLAALDQAGADAFVAPGWTGKPLYLRNWRERNWKPMTAAAGIKATPYMLRHSCASGLIYEGRPLPEVAAILGHGLDLLMSRYAHVVEGARQVERISFSDAALAARSALGVRQMYVVGDAPRPAGRDADADIG